jgi:hypothetical protein
MTAKAKPKRCPNCGYSLSKPRGRPRLLNSKDIDVLKGKLISGMTRGQIAQETGLSRQTISKYLAENVRVGGEWES